MDLELAEVGSLDGGDAFILAGDLEISDIYLKLDGPEQDAVSIRTGKLRRFSASLPVKPVKFYIDSPSPA